MNKSLQGMLFPILTSHTSLDEAIHLNLDLSVQNSSQRLSLPEDETIEVLVNLRTWIHNNFFVEQVSACTTTAKADEATKQQMAMIAFSDHLDAMDEVLARLDARVAERLPQLAPIVRAAHLEQDLMAASVGMNAHESAWLALRSSGTLEEIPPALLPAQAIEGVQIDLPLWASASNDLPAAHARPKLARRRHGARHPLRHRPALPRREVEVVEARAANQPEPAVPTVPARQGRTFRENRSANLQ